MDNTAQTTNLFPSSKSQRLNTLPTPPHKQPCKVLYFCISPFPSHFIILSSSPSSSFYPFNLHHQWVLCSRSDSEAIVAMLPSNQQELRTTALLPLQPTILLSVHKMSVFCSVRATTGKIGSGTWGKRGIKWTAHFTRTDDAPLDQNIVFLLNRAWLGHNSMSIKTGFTKLTIKHKYTQ
jgi:hypothetical protein